MRCLIGSLTGKIYRFCDKYKINGVLGDKSVLEDVLRQGDKKWIGVLAIAAIIGICSPVCAKEVSAKGTGIVGGVAAGAEIVLAVESIVRVKPLWPYIVFPVLGAVGGGIGGYKLQQKSRGGAISLLITGMVGIIPTIIAVKSARAFHPEDVNAREGDNAPSYESFPMERHTTGTGETTTEVESRPEGLPTGPMGPPAPPPSVPPVNDAAPQTAPAPNLEMDAPPPEGPQSRAMVQQQEKIAHLTSGALFHMNRHLRVGLGIPAVGVFPLEFPQPLTHLYGLEFHIPVIAVELPY